MTLKIGDEVLVFAASSSYRGVRGVVVAMAKHTAAAWVQLDGEPQPLCFGVRELILDAREPHVTAGE